MVRKDLLVEAIKASGLKKQHIAATLGLSAQGLANKVDGLRAFKVEEVQTLAKMLGLPQDRRDEIFFAPDGDS